MRLSSLVPSIPANLVAALEASGIRTEGDLLFSASTFDIYRRLPANIVTLQELIDYTAAVAELCSAPGLSGRELYRLEELALTKKFEFLSGNEELDTFLLGLGGKRVIEISGDKGSGKSVLALNLLLHCLRSSPDNTSLWIDTTGDFSSERVMRILGCKQISETVLERMQVSLAFDIETAQALIEDLNQRNDIQLRLIVIDSVTPLLGPLLSAISAQGHAVMTDFMQQLQSFSQRSGATVIVINNTASKGPDTQERKPALGPSFALMTDTTLWLQADQNTIHDGSVLHSIQILKSRSKPIGYSVTFRICNNAIYSP
ncbi:hypothetical protein GALMADRAFT_244701 [Galerina marginata CBS 339.88]|uniref:RecA family profile 1 domain-containing protein n=1 Tax=Galerina marginata (strain CBS 339.88) TaxID=685588 RepID=A0A067T9H6_GALM3|nr:hypothetical protein GALMADRAFT_244701 [Galerina marginata CBS 339.88]